MLKTIGYFYIIAKLLAFLSYSLRAYIHSCIIRYNVISALNYYLLRAHCEFPQSQILQQEEQKEWSGLSFGEQDHQSWSGVHENTIDTLHKL